MERITFSPVAPPLTRGQILHRQDGALFQVADVHGVTYEVFPLAVRRPSLWSRVGHLIAEAWQARLMLRPL
ncbi:MAG: hypothetical protein JWO63_1635 [Frankiales bacterium]|jgi:hypothetical protein|nr:hypothetical protein [Frankiales bacterium]